MTPQREQPEEMMTNDALLKRVAELDAAATKGPWVNDHHSKKYNCGYMFGPNGEMVADKCDGCDGVRLRGVGGNLPQEQNGDFIAESRTLLPLLASRLADAEKEKQTLRECVESIGAQQKQLNADYFTERDALQAENARLKEELALTESRRAALARGDGLNADELDAVWSMIVHSWSIETREFFEREGPKEFAGPVRATPLMKALHHTWKRDPNVTALAEKLTALESVLSKVRGEINHDTRPVMSFGESDGERVCRDDCRKCELAALLPRRCEGCERPIPDDAPVRFTLDDVLLCQECATELSKSDAERPQKERE